MIIWAKALKKWAYEKTFLKNIQQARQKTTEAFLGLFLYKKFWWLFFIFQFFWHDVTKVLNDLWEF